MTTDCPVATRCLSVCSNTTTSSRSVHVLTAALSLPTGVFKYNHLVKKLNLSGLGIEADAASVLAIAVTHNTTLTSIDLSNNPLSDVSVYTGATQHETTGLYALAGDRLSECS